jgi:serine/threonine protein kinase
MNKYIAKEFFDSTYFSKLYKFNNKIIKRIPKILCNKEFPNYDYKNEYNILKKIKEPNIIKIKETYEDTYYFYIVMDYYENGDLYINMKNRNINIKDYKKLIKKLIEPIHTIHKQNIVHLDIKLENYLLSNNSDDFILIDFNLSKNHTSNYYKLETIPTVLGTKSFTAPEIYDQYYCKSSDMYSLGCMLYLIYTNMLYKGDLNLLQNLPFELKGLIIELLDKNYKLRPSVYDVKYYLT